MLVVSGHVRQPVRESSHASSYFAWPNSSSYAFFTCPTDEHQKPQPTPGILSDLSEIVVVLQDPEPDEREPLRNVHGDPMRLCAPLNIHQSDGRMGCLPGVRADAVKPGV